MRRLALFCGGFAVATFLAVTAIAQEQWHLCALLALFSGLVGLIFRKNKAVQRTAIVLLGVSLGFGYTSHWSAEYYDPAEQLAGETHRIEALVTQWPVETDYGYSVIVELQMEDSPALTALLYVDEIGEDIQPGDTLYTIARLNHASFTSAGEAITYYTSKGILLYGSTYGEVEVIHPDSIPFSLLPAHWSKTLREGIEEAFSETAAPLITALVTGNRESLSDEFTSSLQRTGLSHTVAVSGMHLAFLAGMMSLLLGRNRRRTAVVIIPVSILFALIIGGTPSVTRATIMIVMLQIAPLFDREADGATSLSFALLLILLNNPYAVNHVGLQLSFAAVAGIFCCSDWIFTRAMDKLDLKIKRTAPIYLRIVRYFIIAIVATLTATMGAMVFTTPLVAYYFGYVSLIAPISNLLTLWAVAFCFGGGMIAGGLSVLSVQGAALVATLVEPLVDYLNFMITALGRIPFAALPTTSLHAVAWLVLVYLVLAYSIWRKERVAPLFSVAVIVLGLAITINLYVAENRQGNYMVSALDVGQGQSVLLRMGETTLLVDCGGSDDVASGDTAADAIQGCGYFTLDYLILTHCHTDHAGGVSQLLDRMEVGTLILPVSEGEDEGLRSEIIALATEREIPIMLIDDLATLQLEVGEVTLYPPLGDADENERGLTVLATYNDFDTLITGDMGSEMEEILVERYDLPHVELYLVGHHGSKYSTSQTLLDAITPEMAIISVGQNSFGHPTDEVLERLAAMNTEIYRTDLYGTVTIKVG